MTLLRSTTSLCLIALGLAFAPAAAQAQFGRNLFNNPCCNVCKQTVCCCSQRTRPVIETRMRPQQCVTYQDRKRVACRTEAYCETVPVTKVDCVTVDEGCYQMVWVPKPVTKSIPRTEYHQRTAYRTVPYEVCEKVPVTYTQMVPEQTIRYVTEHVAVTTTAPVPLCMPQPACPPASACGPFGIPSVTPGFGGGVPGIPGINAPLGTPAGFGNGPVAVPYSAMKEGVMPMTTVSATPSPAATGLVPDARYAEVHPQAMTQVPLKGTSANFTGYVKPASAQFRAPSAIAVPRRTR
ncbi:MAG: hypothetical protein IT428_06340 [Planctomycetaceae bacterium]|nr:hypothetical protein [Planctomycetaceae bacterium]